MANPACPDILTIPYDEPSVFAFFAISPASLCGYKILRWNFTHCKLSEL